MKTLWIVAVTILTCAPALAQQRATTDKKPPDAELVRMALRVVGPLDMSNAGEKGKTIELYEAYVSFENTADKPATVFAPDIAKRPELAHDWRFRGRRGTPHPYAVRILDPKGQEVKGAQFAVFVGGYAESLNGGAPPPPVCEYKEDWDLLRLAAREKSERHLGYIVTAKGAPSNFTVETALQTDLADEQGAEAQRLIKLAGPEKREFKCSATPTPEENKPRAAPDDNKKKPSPPESPPPPKPTKP